MPVKSCLSKVVGFGLESGMLPAMSHHALCGAPAKRTEHIVMPKSSDAAERVIECVRNWSSASQRTELSHWQGKISSTVL